MDLLGSLRGATFKSAGRLLFPPHAHGLYTHATSRILSALSSTSLSLRRLASSSPVTSSRPRPTVSLCTRRALPRPHARRPWRICRRLGAAAPTVRQVFAGDEHPPGYFNNTFEFSMHLPAASATRYVNDGRPFWQYIASSSTGCSDLQYFGVLYQHYTTEKVSWSQALTWDQMNKENHVQQQVGCMVHQNVYMLCY
ncbi:uncharacterized protein [Miscanthus floridulus]|uniref:uncharacterized protein isoform X1 n=1 Tax=Miscanthus floridulus TaxID=154761 RepID=UPI003459B89D